MNKTINIQPIEKTIGTLFPCPFKQSDALVISHIRNICQKHLASGVIPQTDSAFIIGDKLYHQIGRQFFLHNEEKGGFTYDKDLSDLLYTYFGINYIINYLYLVLIFNLFSDTRHKVIVYSYEKSFDNYIVIIRGKSKRIFRELGEYIFGAFHIGENYAPFLTPISDPKDLPNNPSISFGIESDFIQNKHMIAMTAYNSSDIHLIHSLVFITTKDFHYYELFKTEAESEFLFPFKKNFNSDLWQTKIFHKNDLTVENIVGLYFYDYRLNDPKTLHLVAKSKEFNESVVYNMSSVSFKDSTNTILVLKVLELNEIKVCIQFFLDIY